MLVLRIQCNFVDVLDTELFVVKKLWNYNNWVSIKEKARPATTKVKSHENFS